MRKGLTGEETRLPLWLCIPGRYLMVWVRIREYFHLKHSSLLDSCREKPFVPGGSWLCERCVCSCAVSPISSLLQVEQENTGISVHGLKAGALVFLFSPPVPHQAPWRVECGRKVSCLCEFCFLLLCQQSGFQNNVQNFSSNPMFT